MTMEMGARTLKNIRTIVRIFLVIFAAAVPFSIALAQSALGLALLFWVVSMFLNREWMFPRTVLDPFILAYCAMEIISLVFSIDRHTAWTYSKRLLLILILYLVAANVRDRKWIARLFAALLGVGSILAVIGLCRYLSGLGGLEGRLSLYHHYMTTGGIFMILSLYAFSLVLSEAPVKSRLFGLASGVLTGLPLFLSFTRSAWLGFFTGLAVLFLLFRRKWLPLLALFTALAVLGSPRSMRDRALSAFNPTHETNVERLYMWKAGVRMMLDRPLTGYGDIDLGKIYERYRPAEARQKHGHMHNNLIMIGATLGIPGLLILLALFVRVFVLECGIFRRLPRGEWLLRSAAAGGLASFLGFQVSGLFEWTFGDAELAMLIWFSIGLVLAAERTAAGRPEQQEA
ncbi:O-antigen ligase family protein [bacterium]|nr:O-antigen ligase family protein [bacterium]